MPLGDSPVSLGLALLVTSAHGVAIEEVLVPAVVEAGAVARGLGRWLRRGGGGGPAG